MQSSARIRSFLKNHFGYTEFRPLQQDIIQTILQKQDCLVLMPTGGGKSLCFQLPSLIMGGITLVVSPLIALMKDQVDALTTNGISAAFLNSSLSKQEQQDVYERVQRGQIKLLYIAPERFALQEFRLFLREIPVQLIAIDEAHCISEWGHDFRPEYRNLKQVRIFLPGVPVIALTATATQRVREDIIVQLGLQRAPQFVASFNRPNLHYTILPKLQSLKRITGLLEKNAGAPAIIYCFSRNGTETLAAQLRDKGFNALPYHAGLTPTVRSKTQEKFIRDRVPIIVATIAFGMGIDKPDIRLVIHADLPKTLEGYYQETGRAGRDGLKSECVLLFSRGDQRKHLFFIDQMENENERTIAKQKLDIMITYCESLTCRRAFVMQYFGEAWNTNTCKSCDRCLSPGETFDATEISQKILSAILRTGQRYGMMYVIDILKGSRTAAVIERNHETLSVFGIVGREYHRDDLRFIAQQLLTRGLIKKTEDDYVVILVSEKGKSWLYGRESITLLQPETSRTPLKEQGTDAALYDKKLFEILRELRKTLAGEKNVPPFIIFGDRTLIEMATYLPQTPESLSTLFGVGTQKLAAFGPKFLTIIQDYANEQKQK